VSLTPLTTEKVNFKIEFISVNTKLNAKRLSPVDQGPRWSSLMKKFGDLKSRDNASVTGERTINLYITSNNSFIETKANNNITILFLKNENHQR
jgi:hypothetical protein